MRSILLLFILLCSVSFSQNNGIVFWNQSSAPAQLNTITTAVPFLRIGPDARAAGIGDQGIALSPDAFSFHWNTAQLAFSDKKFEVGGSFFPWLHNLVGGMYSGSVSGYGTFGKKRIHAIGGTFSFFSHGTVAFANSNGNVLYEYKPFEFRALGGYALKLSDHSSLGVNAQFIYSNLFNDASLGIRPAYTFAGDISYAYENRDLKLAGLSSALRWGVTIANLGGRIDYAPSDNVNGDFIPANLGIGLSYGVHFNEDHGLTLITNFNKLLVQASPIRDDNGDFIPGSEPNNSTVPESWVRSFYDAPGTGSFNSAGNFEMDKGSKFREEMREINFSLGAEYNFDEFFSARFGYFHEHYTKGNRKFLTFGLGGGYYGFRLDVSYWASLVQNNPLANTVKFTLTYSLDRKE